MLTLNTGAFRSSMVTFVKEVCVVPEAFSVPFSRAFVAKRLVGDPRKFLPKFSHAAVENQVVH